MIMQVHIAQRGAITPLIKMLESSDEQVTEMAAFALGRLAQVVMFLNKHVNLFDALCHKNNGCNLFA